MMDRYEPAAFEAKWRERWKQADLFRTQEDPGRPKFYGLDFFPYPSGAGLSVGHCRNYIPTDVICRMKRMQGHNVLHPMGFDAFGLPAENEAIKRQSHPAPMIDQYAATYQRQMELVGIGYDWSRSFKSSDPGYYRWTQWIFKLLYDRGLAYRQDAEINWCPKDKTALANEEVVGGLCERCGAPVEKRNIPQWFFKITEYAQRLIDDLDTVDWPEGIKHQQRNWIGRSEGVEFQMEIDLSGPTLPLDRALDGFAEEWPKVQDQARQLVEKLQAVEASLSGLAASDPDWDELAADASSLAADASDLLLAIETLGPDPQVEALIRQAIALHKHGARVEKGAEKLAPRVRKMEAEDPATHQLRDSIAMTLDEASELADDVEDCFEDFAEEARIREEELDDFEIGPPQGNPTFRVFTTRIDTIFGMTFCVLAPEHPLVETILANTDKRSRKQVRRYIKQAGSLSDTARQNAEREKTGVFTGAYAINPANQRMVPVWVADYVLMGYGTGAIMAVPGHDERDFEFAQKFGIPIVPVISPSVDVEPELPFPAKDGVLIHSGSYTGKPVAQAQAELADWIEGSELGTRKVNYKIRDWLVSRQRYWGCPIPMIYDQEGNMEPASDDSLPVLLPEVENYQPGDDGSSPLAGIPEFVNCATSDGKLGRRETDTMSGFACSSWYFLRFCDPFNEEKAWDIEKVKAWMPVDCYVGGAEHAVMHLLYARFWTKVLYDAGLVPFHEPFARLMNQGQVLAQTPYRAPREGETLDLGEDGILVSFAEAAEMAPEDLTWKWVRMSKSKGNVVTPDEAVEQYGADALRIYELFVAPFEQNVQWSNEGMQGAARFLSRVCRLASELAGRYEPNWKLEIDAHPMTDRAKKIRRITHQTIAKATADIERFAHNTYVSSMMIAVNSWTDLLKEAGEDPSETLALSEALETMILLVSPAAPHTADELWEQIDRSGFTLDAAWPKSKPELAEEDTVTIAVQVNGKLRDTLELPAGASQEELQAAALASAKVQVHLDGKTVRKVVVVPGKLVNVVAS